MEAAGGSGGSTINNSKVLRNAYKLFDILHDDKIPAKNKLPLMTEVLSGVDVDINVPNEHDGRNTLLHGAVVHGFIYVVKLLLQYKANVDSRNTEGETPLHLVLSDKRINKSKVQKPIIQILLGHKADVNIKNLAGVTPRDLVKEKNNKILNDLFDPIFNKPDPAPEDEIYPDQGNNAGDADTSFARDANQVEQAEDAFADFKDTYAASGAKHSFHGTVYQLCLLMMFALRAFRLGYPFRLGTEADEGAQFDDIVLYQHPQGGKRTALFVQAKHKDNADKGLNLNDLLAKGNNAQFSLLKYFKSFVKIMQAEGQKASKIDFAICTNIHFEFDQECKLIGDKITLSLEIVTNMYQEFFKEGKCYKLVTDDKPVEPLKEYFDTEYKAELSLLTDSISKTEELNDILSSLNDGTSLGTFLNNLTFVVEQPADSELVKTEFRAQSKPNLLDTDSLTDAFYKQIFDWFSNKKGVWLTNETIEKMIDSITGTINTFASSGISRDHAENFLTSPLKFNEDKLEEIIKLITNNTIVNVATSVESKLPLIQVAQAIERSGSYVELDSYMFMRVSSLLPGDGKDLTADAFKSPGKHDLLVVDCLSKTEQVSQRELTALGKKLLGITTNNSKKKLVIIAPEKYALTEMFRSCSGYVSHTVTNKWKDFTSETQDVLSATQVYFQGLPVELNQVIDKNETELLEIVPIETLIDESLVIGTELPSHIGYNESYYIERSVNSVNQIVLKADIFQDKLKEKFQEELALSESDFKNLCIKNTEANIHLLQKQEDRYVWVKSQGEFKALRPYIDNHNYQSCLEEEFLESVKQQRVVIISDQAGMGKSTVLTHFSNKIKANTEGSLVFRIDLNNYTTLLLKQKSTIFDNSSALDFICNEIIMIKTPLESALFKRKGQVVLLFDGFDEISPDYAETVLGLIQRLIEATEAQIWITTRPFMKETLEDKFRQWSSYLEPFSKQNQVDYLFMYWKHMTNIKDSDEERIKDFAKSLISHFSESISDKEQEFTGIPLQMKMLAECFVDDLEKLPDLTECFNLVDLYTTFIEKKIHIYDNEKNETDGSKVAAKYKQKLTYATCIKQHQYLSLTVIVSDDKFALQLSEDKISIDSDDKIMINKIGIVNLDHDTPQFIHRTFAEYWVAEYFKEQQLKDPTCIRPEVKSFILSELLISDNYAVVRSFLNGLLATDTSSEFKNPLLTKDDINNKYAEIKQIFIRTAIEGNSNIFKKLLNGVEGKDEGVLKLLLGNDPDERLLNLAAENNNSKFIESLLKYTRDNTDQDQETVKQILEARDGRGSTPLTAASWQGHNVVVQTLLQWTRDNLTGWQGIVKQMLEPSDDRGDTPLSAASGRGHIAVVQTLLKWTSEHLTEGQDKVKQMLVTRGGTGWTPLNAASREGRNAVVQTLLQWTLDNLTEGQDIVKQMLEARDGTGSTPLSAASVLGHNAVVQTLLQWTSEHLTEGQDIVKQMLETRDDIGSTPLNAASGGGHNAVVQTLLQWTRGNLGEETLRELLLLRDRWGRTALSHPHEKLNPTVCDKIMEWAEGNNNINIQEYITALYTESDNED